MRILYELRYEYIHLVSSQISPINILPLPPRFPFGNGSADASGPNRAKHKAKKLHFVFTKFKVFHCLYIYFTSTFPPADKPLDLTEYK